MARNPLTMRNRSRRSEVLRNVTIREFDGGLNVADSDLNLASKFAVVLKNMYRAEDGTQAVRYGTRLFVEIPELDTIIGMRYYANTIIAVDRNGKIASIDGQGNYIIIWNEQFAASLPDNPMPWSRELEFVDFTVFRGELIITNGIDKPLVVDNQLRCQYLFDRGTGTNINTPIGRYVTSANEYTIIAGDPQNPSLLHFSNESSSGTWLNDEEPNNATDFDLGPWIPVGSERIKGITGFRDKLIVSFEENIIIMQIGEKNEDGDHIPRVEDVVPQHGAISQRSVQSLGDDILFCDIVGVPSLKRSVFTDTLRPERVSQLVDPEIQRRLERLSTAALEDRVFSVYNRNESQYMLFIPNASKREDTTETICFVWTLNNQLKIQAWAEFRGWNWSSATRSAQGRIFFSQSNVIFVLGTREDEIYADLVDYAEPFDDGEVFSDGTGFLVEGNPSDLNYSTGLPRSFDWHQPWADFGERSLVKMLRYIGVESRGDGEFELQLFVDNILEDRSTLGEPFTDNTTFDDGYGWRGETPEYAPARIMPMLGGDAQSFGGQGFGNSPFGGGRVTADERLFAMPLHNKILKFRITGRSSRNLRFTSLRAEYAMGSLRR